ncbi:MAG: hypothetical protein OXI43_13530 [Candidatus Poribacteria bacterium]|nr:hypothetical protein [Candidatus Poribacteria bacterium]
MTKKMYAGLGVLIIFLTIIGFVFMHQSREIEQLRQEAADSLKQIETSTPKPVIVEKGNTRPPPPGKSFEGGGHWHGDEWHDAPHIDAPTNDIAQQDKVKLLTPEEINQVAISQNAREQALKDHETIAMYYHNEKVYYSKYERLREDNKKIQEEFDKFYVPQDKINELSEIEKIQHADRLKLILRKLDLNQARFDTLKKNKPVRPDEALHRYQEYSKLATSK